MILLVCEKPFTMKPGGTGKKTEIYTEKRSMEIQLEDDPNLAGSKTCASIIGAFNHQAPSGVTSERA